MTYSFDSFFSKINPLSNVDYFVYKTYVWMECYILCCYRKIISNEVVRCCLMLRRFNCFNGYRSFVFKYNFMCIWYFKYRIITAAINERLKKTLVYSFIFEINIRLFVDNKSFIMESVTKKQQLRTAKTPYGASMWTMVYKRQKSGT